MRGGRVSSVDAPLPAQQLLLGAVAAEQMVS
jgi:hypothetical protein